jgi:hypothetical protein
MVGVQRFTSDSYGGEDVYQAGIRLEGGVSLAFPLGPRESGLVYGGIYAAGAGTARREMQFLGTLDNPARSVSNAGLELSVQRGRVEVLPAAEVRLIRSEDGLGQGWSGSLGARARYRVFGLAWGAKTLIEPAISFSMGRLVPSEGAASGVTGLSAGLTLRWEGGR